MTAAADPPDNLEPQALEALMRWYLAMGVDASMNEVARDCFTQPEPTRVRVDHLDVSKQASVSTRKGAQSVASADALTSQADALAAGARTLDELRIRWASLPGCGLAVTATRMIFEGGKPGAPIMLVGGAPDSEDERQGEAFFGSKGRLLDAMLLAIGLDRTQVYLSNIIPWRPPGNRTPTPLELGLCLPFARRQIELAAPAILVCLGERAAQPLLRTAEPVSKLRGRWMSFEGATAPVQTLVTFSLDYLLKQPLQKRRAWSDLLMIAHQLRS